MLPVRNAKKAVILCVPADMPNWLARDSFKWLFILGRIYHHLFHLSLKFQYFKASALFVVHKVQRSSKLTVRQQC